MNDLICRKNNSHGTCLLATIAKILLVLLVAELAIYAYVTLVGFESTNEDFVKIILRMVLVAAGVYLIFGVKRVDVSVNEDLTADVELIVQDADQDDLKQWPNIDALTRTSNERGLTISVLELMALADRYGHKLSIGMIRIAGMSKVDDSVAEELMIQTAGLMTESLRMPDRIGRFKENVFMALLPESDINGATIVAERLHESLDAGMSTASDEVAVWIGMTEFHRGEDLQSLLDRVESAMEQAEKEKNGICIKN